MPKDCLGSDAKVELSECDLNGTVNCLTCGREGLSTVRMHAPYEVGIAGLFLACALAHFFRIAS